MSGQNKEKQHYCVKINGEELCKAKTMTVVARKLTAFYNCPYVNFSRDTVYNIIVGRYNDSHSHIEISRVAADAAGEVAHTVS